MNFLKSDSTIMRALAKVFDIVCLNLIFTLCCIPVITAGPALCGLYRGCLCVCRGEGNPIKAMWSAFWANFRQGLLIWLGELLVGAVIALVFLFGGAAAGTSIVLVPMLAISVLYMMQLGLVFPLLSRFENSIGGTVKNALLLSIRHFPAALLCSVLNGLPVLMYVLSPELFMAAIWLWCFGVYGGVVCLQVLCIERRIFSAYSK